MIYGVLDMARDRSGEIETALARYAPETMCLYREPMSDKVRRRAPYLVKLPDQSNFIEFWLQRGWGSAWGIIVQSDHQIETLHHHLRRFLTVMLPDGRKALLRFYDPRVLPTYLRSCNVVELAEWFSKIRSFRVERTDTAHYLDFRFNGSCLVEAEPS